MSFLPGGSVTLRMAPLTGVAAAAAPVSSTRGTRTLDRLARTAMFSPGVAESAAGRQHAACSAARSSA
jgi:hypothetical protein